MKKYVVEALGAGMLSLVVGLAVAGSSAVFTPLLAALTLALFVYSIGHVSGAHINPAVTAGLWSIGKIKSEEALKYMLAQFIGAGVALVALGSLVGEGLKMSGANDVSVLAAELVGTAIFTFGIASVVFGKAPSVMSGLVIGWSLLLGIMVSAMLGASGVLNPAVALALGTFNVSYILGPVLGSVLGMQLYKRLAA